MPKRYASVEPRRVVYVALSTDSLREAERKGAAVWAEMVAGWEQRLKGASDDAAERFAAAQELAKSRGFRYMPAARVAELPIEDIAARVRAVQRGKGGADRVEAAALLGGAQEPSLRVSAVLEAYWGLTQDRTAGKSADQLRRWRNPRIKAVKNFIAAVGDLEFAAISREDMLDFRGWLQDRMSEGDIVPSSANKDLLHLADVLKTVNRMRRLGLDLPLGDLSFREGSKRTRPPFTVEWLREKILAPGALDGLNPDARGLLMGMINTGYRPSEGAGLTAATIHLDCNIPHISIEPGERALKTKNAQRVIPLTGVSLEAFRAFPSGFARYARSADPAAPVNKYLRENKLVPTDRHTMYSIRHTFEDRMIAAGIDDRIRRDLFGHSLGRERYGGGASLEQAAELLRGMAI